MSGSTEFLLYVTVYRLTVLAIGALSIYLGFRLFSRPPGVIDSGENSSSVGVQAGKFRLRVMNLLPGIYFALFGTVLIGIMLNVRSTGCYSISGFLRSQSVSGARLSIATSPWASGSLSQLNKAGSGGQERGVIPI